MAGRKPRHEDIKERAHGNASAARHWLRVNHRRLRKRLAVRFPPYAEVAAEMAALGMTGGAGDPPRRPVPLTGRAVERMWKGVCRDVAADAAKRAPRREAAPAGWKPTVVAPSRTAPAPRPRPAPVAEAGDHSMETQLASLQRVLDRRSGR